MVSNKKIHRALRTHSHTNSYEQYPLEKFFIFTIYQNYTCTLALTLIIVFSCRTQSQPVTVRFEDDFRFGTLTTVDIPLTIFNTFLTDLHVCTCQLYSPDPWVPGDGRDLHRVAFLGCYTTWPSPRQAGQYLRRNPRPSPRQTGQYLHKNPRPNPRQARQYLRKNPGQVPDRPGSICIEIPGQVPTLDSGALQPPGNPTHRDS